MGEKKLAQAAPTISHISTRNAYHTGKGLYVRKVAGSLELGERRGFAHVRKIHENFRLVLKTFTRLGREGGGMTSRLLRTIVVLNFTSALGHRAINL